MKETDTSSNGFEQGDTIATVGESVTAEMFTVIGNRIIEKVDNRLIVGANYPFSITSISEDWQYNGPHNVAS